MLCNKDILSVKKNIDEGAVIREKSFKTCAPESCVSVANCCLIPLCFATLIGLSFVNSRCGDF